MQVSLSQSVTDCNPRKFLIAHGGRCVCSCHTAAPQSAAPRIQPLIVPRVRVMSEFGGDFRRHMGLRRKNIMRLVPLALRYVRDVAEGRLESVW